jgi:hypothetical protein
VRSTSFAAGFDPTPLPPLGSTGKDTQREEGLRERAGRKPLSLCSGAFRGVRPSRIDNDRNKIRGRC